MASTLADLAPSNAIMEPSGDTWMLSMSGTVVIDSASGCDRPVRTFTNEMSAPSNSPLPGWVVVRSSRMDVPEGPGLRRAHDVDHGDPKEDQDGHHDQPAEHPAHGRTSRCSPTSL